MDVASGDLTDPAPDSTPCDDPTTDPQALEGLILEKSKDQEDAMGGAVQAEQEAEQHSVIMRVAIFTWGIHGGGADPRLLGQQHTSEGWDKAWGLRHPCVGSDAGRGQIGDVINAAGFPLNHFSRKLARAAARDRK